MTLASRTLIALAALAAFIPDPAHAADAGKGASLFKNKCFVCHDSVAGKHKIGPSLFAIVGRKAGTADGFKLYRGLKDADWVWDEASIREYLADPIKYIKDRTGKASGMVLKVPKTSERDDIVAYLKTLK